MRHLRLVIDNTRAGALAAPFASGRRPSSRRRLSSTTSNAHRATAAFERILSARVGQGQSTLRELLQQANASLARTGPDSQAWLSQQMIALMKIGLLLDVSLSPEYPAHFMIYDAADLVRWLPSLRAYRHELPPGVTFA